MTLFRLFRRRKSPSESQRRQPLRRLAAALLLFLGSIVVGLLLFFPRQLLIERLEAEATAQGVHLTLEKLSLGLPLQIVAHGVRIAPPSPWPLQSFTQVRCTPLFSSLFSADPHLLVVAKQADGEIRARLSRKGNLELEIEDFSLALPLPELPSLTLQTRIEQASLHTAWPLTPEVSSSLRVGISRLQVSGMSSLGSSSDTVSLGRVSLAASGQGNNLKLESLAAAEGDISARGSGNLTLNRHVSSSRIHLDIELQPQPSLDPTLASLLEVALSKEGDSLRLRAGGTLNHLRIRP